MIDVTDTVQIDRPAEDVFAFVADQTNAPRWQQGLYEVRRLTPGPPRVGTEHEFIRKFAGRRFAERNRFVEFEPGRFVAFEIPGGWLTGRASYRAEPRLEGGTLLTSHMQFHGHGLAWLLEWPLGRLLARDSRRDSATLKRILEQGS